MASGVIERSPAAEIARQIGPSEKICWEGQPRQGVRFHGYDIILIPFSFAWFASSAFMLGVFVWDLLEPDSKGVPVLAFLALLVPHVCFGLYLLLGRFLVGAWVRRHIFYAVTTERILIVSGIFSRRVRSLNLRTLSDLGLSEKSDGSGTIHFGPPSPMWASAQVPGWYSYPGAKSSAGFESIPDSRRIYDLIRATQQGAV